MRKIRFISFILTAVLAASLLVMPAPLSVSAAKAEFNAVEEPVPEGNVLPGSDFDTADPACLKLANNMAQIETPTGSYMQISRITTNYVGFNLSQPKKAVLNGIYKFTGYFRMMYEDEVTDLRVTVSQKSWDGKTVTDLTTVNVSPTHKEWMKVEFYVEITEQFNSILINGGPDSKYVQPYCIDNISLVKVDAFPDGYEHPTQIGTFVGPAKAEKSQVDSLVLWEAWTKEYEEQFEVKGVIVNQDADAFISSANSSNEKAYKDFALGYKDSHVTDFMICVNNTNATFPSETWTDLAEKYLQREENGQRVNYSKDPTAKLAYNHFIKNGLDYIKTWCETFPTIGINPWISFRMNDIHDHGEKTSRLLSDFYHEHPEVRRMGDRTGGFSSGYARFAPDYMKELSRTHMLDLINEALSRYDCYGIELDWQREIYLFGYGDEYNGLDVLNDFMREVARIVEIYEEKYGHEIKIAIRCASDIETNYDFGLDILTWAAEDMLDLAIPTGHYTTSDTDIPVTEWVSLLKPYGVEIAPCIEEFLQPNPTSAGRGKNTLQTYNGSAAAYFSLGADKIALYNAYLGEGQRLTEKHRVSTEAEDVSGSFRHWNIVSTIGSPEKLMIRDRRVVLTYNDTHMFWRQSDAQLPASCSAGETVTLRLPVGDIPANATVYVKFGANAQNIARRPAVNVNSKAATFANLELCEGGFSNMQLLTYTVPASAFNSPYFVIEITPQKNFSTDYIEVLVDVN